MKAIKTILHPTDFSPHSRYALDLACVLACDIGARLIVLHVVPREAPVVGPADPALRRDERHQYDLKAYRDEMLQQLNRLALPTFEVGAERLLKEGDVASVILRTAEENCCDFILMGTHGNDSGRSRAMGSVAERVSREAACAVVTVRAPDHVAANRIGEGAEKAHATY